jgi:hypothetical protein
MYKFIGLGLGISTREENKGDDRLGVASSSIVTAQLMP